MTRFTYITSGGRKLVYEMPTGIDVEVDDRGDVLDFNFVKDGEHIAMFGGTLEDGSEAESWADVGIRMIEDVRPAP